MTPHLSLIGCVGHTVGRFGDGGVLFRGFGDVCVEVLWVATNHGNL